MAKGGQSMKIVIFGYQQLGALEEERVVDLRRALAVAEADAGRPEPERTAGARLGSDLAGFIGGGPPTLEAAREAIEFARRHPDLPGVCHPLDQVTLRAPWPRRRIACAGGNYADHLAGIQGGGSLEDIRRQVRQGGQWGFWKVPCEPLGTGDDIPYPTRTAYLDYEGEVAIVVGKRGKDITAARFEEHVFGVTLVNDVSIRDLDRPGGVGGNSYNLAKNFDGSTAIGPVLVVDEGLDPSSIDVEVRVNGQTRQKFNSSGMIWSFAEILEYLSRDFTFVPGDIISGGTAKGTALDQTPRPPEGQPRAQDLFLKRGDTVEVSSPQVGVLANRVI
jgi:2-keto-4-pentenoate hydratase/2-oxohepta-3-ene-1,7-dioic acid hydratase in catechol pathway